MSKIHPGGYYVVHRAIYSHWLWEERKLSKWEAWQWLIAYANYEDKKWRHKNEIVLVVRGQLITSIGQLQKTFKWTNYETRTFLKLLADDDMIHLETTSSFTRLTICKYEDYQNISLTKHSKEKKKPLAVEPHLFPEIATTEGIKEPNEIKEVKKESVVFSPADLEKFIKQADEWKTRTSATYKISIPDFEAQSTTFIAEQTAKMKVWANQKDAINHLLSWIKIQKINNKPQSAIKKLIKNGNTD